MWEKEEISAFVFQNFLKVFSHAIPITLTNSLTKEYRQHWTKSKKLPARGLRGIFTVIQSCPIILNMFGWGGGVWYVLHNMLVWGGGGLVGGIG